MGLMAIKVVSQVPIREIDGKELGVTPALPEIIVRSHWNRNELVVLEIDGKKYTLAATDLQGAISNATNTRRHG